MATVSLRMPQGNLVTALVSIKASVPPRAGDPIRPAYNPNEPKDVRLDPVRYF